MCEYVIRESIQDHKTDDSLIVYLCKLATQHEITENFSNQTTRTTNLGFDLELT